MPIQVTYPGVYIEELPSGSKTISGVATAVTAFVGRALRGPTDQDGPVTIFGFDDFVGTFGGLHKDYPMSYAVQDFFLNGGAKAVIVRIYKDNEDIEGNGAGDLVIDNLASAKSAAEKVADAAEEELYNPADKAATKDTVIAAAKAMADTISGEPMATAAAAVVAAMEGAGDDPEAIVKAGKEATKTVEGGEEIAPEEQLRFEAANPGDWGNFLKVSVDHINIDSSLDHLYEGLTHNDLFNLEVSYAPAGGLPVNERHINLTIADGYDGERRLDRVLENESILLRALKDPTTLKPIWPNKRPEPTIYKASGGDDGIGLDTLAYLGNQKKKTGFYALEKVDLFNIMCIPPDGRDPANAKTWDTPIDVYQSAAVYCQARRSMLIIDPPKAWSDKAKTGKMADISLSATYNFADAGRNCAVYFPRVKRSNPMLKGAIEVFPACGMIAGVMSRTDINRGIWKAPAGTEAGLVGARGLELPVTDNENGLLNPQGINCIRTFPVIGTVAWGGRTLRGADQLSDDYKYINVRRLTLYIEESLFRGTQFAVFEPNAPELWSTLKSAADSFMASLAKQGAFYSYEVVCDESTTTNRDINLGRVNLLVAFAPVKPAEFVVIQIQQQALKE